MKTIIKFLFVLFILTGVFNVVLANTTVHLYISSTNSPVFNQNISVAPCDSENNGILTITPYCAILQSGIQNSWDWTWAPGAFLSSLNNIMI